MSRRVCIDAPDNTPAHITAAVDIPNADSGSVPAPDTPRRPRHTLPHPSALPTTPPLYEEFLDVPGRPATAFLLPHETLSIDRASVTSTDGDKPQYF